MHPRKPAAASLLRESARSPCSPNQRLTTFCLTHPFAWFYITRTLASTDELSKTWRRPPSGSRCAQSVAQTPRRHRFRRTPWLDFFPVGTSYRSALQSPDRQQANNRSALLDSSAEMRAPAPAFGSTGHSRPSHPACCWPPQQRHRKVRSNPKTSKLQIRRTPRSKRCSTWLQRSSTGRHSRIEQDIDWVGRGRRQKHAERQPGLNLRHRDHLDQRLMNGRPAFGYWNHYR